MSSSIAVIGQRIRMLRQKMELTQEELGKVFNVNKTTISHYEKGERCPSIEMLIRISDYFDVTILYILGINNIGKDDGKEIRLSDEEIEFIKEIRKISSYESLIVNPKNYAKLIDIKTANYKIKM